MIRLISLTFIYYKDVWLIYVYDIILLLFGLFLDWAIPIIINYWPISGHVHEHSDTFKLMATAMTKIFIN